MRARKPREADVRLIDDYFYDYNAWANARAAPGSRTHQHEQDRFKTKVDTQWQCGAGLGPRCGAGNLSTTGLSSARYALISMSRLPDPGRVGGRRDTANTEHCTRAVTGWSVDARPRVTARRYRVPMQWSVKGQQVLPGGGQ